MNIIDYKPILNIASKLQLAVNSWFLVRIRFVIILLLFPFENECEEVISGEALREGGRRAHES